MYYLALLYLPFTTLPACIASSVTHPMYCCATAGLPVWRVQGFDQLRHSDVKYAELGFSPHSARRSNAVISQYPLHRGLRREECSSAYNGVVGS